MYLKNYKLFDYFEIFSSLFFFTFVLGKIFKELGK